MPGYGLDFLDPNDDIINGIGSGFKRALGAVDPFSRAAFSPAPSPLPFTSPDGPGGYLDPKEAGQKKALGVDMTQNTWPPRTPSAPTTGAPSMQSLTGLNPGNLDQFKGHPSPLGPTDDAGFMKEMGTRRAQAEAPHIRFSTDGGPMQDYKRPADDSGADRTDYSKAENWEGRVANPSAFEGYRELPDVKMHDILSRDPFAPQRVAADIKANQELGVYQGERQLDLQTEGQRAARYASVDAQRNADLAALHSSPKFQAASKEDQMRAENHIKDAYDQQVAALEHGSAKLTGKTGGGTL